MGEKLSRYDNLIKDQARGWAWNRICERIPSSIDRKRARVYCLIGDTTKELHTAIDKGFSIHNVIGVDIKPESVKLWRAAGGLAIEAPIEAVLAFSKVSPQAVIADFCSGLTSKSFDCFLDALRRTTYPGCVVLNLLRGRDEIDKFRPDQLLSLLDTLGASTSQKESAKKRSTFVLYRLFMIVRGQLLDRAINWQSLTKDQLRQLTGDFDFYFRDFLRKLNPQYHEYQSAHSKQYFDTLAINAFMPPSLPVTDLSGWKEYEVPLIKRRLAALEAVRTQRLNALPERKRALLGV